MNVTLYKNSSQNNVVDKKLSGAITLEGVRFKDSNSLDVVTPTILINQWQDVGDAIGYNYVYIPKFKSYYYASISWQGSLAEISCRRDVLMSVKDEIKASTQYVTRQENKKNRYLVDSQLPIHSDHTYLIKPFGEMVENPNCIHVILETIGRLS